jgi:hypothetical protein
MAPAEYDRRKLEELVLYVALRLEGNPTFGRTKLVKMLFFSDFQAYEQLGRSITGAVYLKREFGPCPKAYPEIEGQLKASQRAYERSVPAGPFKQRRLVALTAPDLTLFTADEIAIVDAVIERHRDDSATDVSELSHRFAGWQKAEIGEEIPYFTALVPARPLALSSDELVRARAEAVRLFDAVP